MRHVRPVSCQRPAFAQFEPVIQLIGVANAILGLFNDFLDLLRRFGYTIPQKLAGDS
jgi:hypothetical protein